MKTRREGPKTESRQFVLRSLAVRDSGLIQANARQQGQLARQQIIGFLVKSPAHFPTMAKRNLRPILGVTALCASHIAVAECKDDHPLQKLLRKFKRPKPPKPQVVDNFLSAKEAAYLLDRYEFLMKESRSVGYV